MHPICRREHVDPVDPLKVKMSVTMSGGETSIVSGTRERQHVWHEYKYTAAHPVSKHSCPQTYHLYSTVATIMASTGKIPINGSPNDLDDSLYQLDEDELEFLSSQTGIKDPIELKRHVVNVQREAYAVCVICFVNYGIWV